MENTPNIYTIDELEELIARWGFLPFFRNKVGGFSIQDVMDEERVFNDGPDCAWKWKSTIISHGSCVYGKFFGGGRAGYIHMRWLPDFMNWRRTQYPLETYSLEARRVLDVLRTHESMSSRMLKQECGFTLSRRKKRLPDPSNPAGFVRESNTGADFNALISRLQMGTYVCIADFEPVSERRADSGWTLSVYALLDALYDFAAEELDFFATRAAVRAASSSPVSSVVAGAGRDWSSRSASLASTMPLPPSVSPIASTPMSLPSVAWLSAVEGRSPEQSRDRILSHLRRLFPSTPFPLLAKLI